MKQFLYEIVSNSKKDNSFDEARRYAKEHEGFQVLAHIYFGYAQLDKTMEMVSYLKSLFPGIKIAGSSSCGEIKDGHLTDRSIQISISFF